MYVSFTMEKPFVFICLYTVSYLGNLSNKPCVLLPASLFCSLISRTTCSHRSSKISFCKLSIYAKWHLFLAVVRL